MTDPASEKLIHLVRRWVQQSVMPLRAEMRQERTPATPPIRQSSTSPAKVVVPHPEVRHSPRNSEKVQLTNPQLEASVISQITVLHEGQSNILNPGTYQQFHSRLPSQTTTYTRSCWTACTVLDGSYRPQPSRVRFGTPTVTPFGTTVWCWRQLRWPTEPPPGWPSSEDVHLGGSGA